MPGDPDSGPDPDSAGGGDPGEGSSGGDGDDPRQVNVIAVHADDVVTALETNRRGAAEGRAVLRVTPPFSGRMRARIHLERGDDDPDTVAVAPADLVSEVPPYPEPDDTADALRADPDTEYTRERHRERHAAAVERWRDAVRERVADRAPLTDDHTADVVVIGRG